MAEAAIAGTEEKLRLDSLVEDLKVYPRGAVSDMRVDDLAYAHDAGSVLPPIVVDRKTRKIVDGFHRARALRKRLGKDASVPCVVREFADDAEMLLESARLNSGHGLPLGRHDQRVVVLRARQLGAQNEDIAAALGITPQRLTAIAIRVAQSDDGEVPLKRGTEHLSGHYLNKDQVDKIRKMRGAPIAAKARELSGLIQSGIAPMSDPDVQASLRELLMVIDVALVAQARQEAG